MHYAINDTKITFYAENEKNVDDSETYASFEGSKLAVENVILMCDAACKQMQGAKPVSQFNFIRRFLSPILSYFRLFAEEPFPDSSNDWQILLLEFFNFYLTSQYWAKASVATRMDDWRVVKAGFQFWQEEEILPCDVFIPYINKRQIRSNAKDQPLLGQFEAKPTSTNKPVQKLLVNIDFAMSDADYLDAIERECRQKISLIKEVCVSHWDALVVDGKIGIELASSVKMEECKDGKRLLRGRKVFAASEYSPEGHAWALAIALQRLEEGKENDCISTAVLRSLPSFSPTSLRGNGYEQLSTLTAMPKDAYKKLFAYTKFYRFLGLLSPLDAAVACCLLIMEHPKFTPGALRDAKLLNARGKYYLYLSDNEDSPLLSLDKPRARNRKIAVLSPLTKKIVAEIIERTSKARTVLRRAGDKAWRFLFIGVCANGRLGPFGELSRHLASETVVCLTRLYPTLQQNGLGAGSFDFQRIRTTMGVLRWFETGSILEMSRTLGNTTRVAIKHYLPPALLHAWNTRIIRRFQNTLIVLAAYREEYLLEVTDFSNVADLQNFIAQLIVEFPGDSSPLALEVQSRLVRKNMDSCTNDMINGQGLLNIRLSSESLGCLYAFSEYAASNLNEEELNKIDPISKLNPKQFVDLARLIRHACEEEEISPGLGEIIDVKKLRELHSKAVAQQLVVEKQNGRMLISGTWASNG